MLPSERNSREFSGHTHPGPESSGTYRGSAVVQGFARCSTSAPRAVTGNTERFVVLLNPALFKTGIAVPRRYYSPLDTGVGSAFDMQAR